MAALSGIASLSSRQVQCISMVFNYSGLKCSSSNQVTSSEQWTYTGRYFRIPRLTFIVSCDNHEVSPLGLHSLDPKRFHSTYFAPSPQILLFNVKKRTKQVQAPASAKSSFSTYVTKYQSIQNHSNLVRVASLKCGRNTVDSSERGRELSVWLWHQTNQNAVVFAYWFPTTIALRTSAIVKVSGQNCFRILVLWGLRVSSQRFCLWKVPPTFLHGSTKDSPRFYKGCASFAVPDPSWAAKKFCGRFPITSFPVPQLGFAFFPTALVLQPE